MSLLELIYKTGSIWLTCNDDESIQLFCILMWKTRHCRNEVVLRNARPDPVNLSASSFSFVQEYNMINSFRSAPRTTSEHVPDNSASLRAFNIFVDAGCFPNGSTSWGLCIKDQDNVITFSDCKKESIVVEPSTAEALSEMGSTNSYPMWTY